MEKEATTQEDAAHAREGVGALKWLASAVDASVCGVEGNHLGRLLALGLGLVRKVRKKALHRVNARIQGFPALDLCDGVKRHPGCLRDFLNLRKASGVKMLQKGVENRCHVPHLTGCGKPTQHISYRLR